MASLAIAIYRAGVNMPSLSPDEIRAAAETHRDLGPEYQSAVIESFLDRVGREIDARVDARLAAAQLPIQQQQQYQHSSPGRIANALRWPSRSCRWRSASR